MDGGGEGKRGTGKMGGGNTNWDVKNNKQTRDNFLKYSRVYCSDYNS